MDLDWKLILEITIAIVLGKGFCFFCYCFETAKYPFQE
jgi:hypothetical protein